MVMWKIGCWYAAGHWLFCTEFSPEESHKVWECVRMSVLDNETFLTKNRIRSLNLIWDNCGDNVLWQWLLVCLSCCCWIHDLPCWYRRHTVDLPFDGVKLTLSLSVHNLCTCKTHRPRQIHKKDCTKRRSLMPTANPPGQSLPVSLVAWVG